MAPDGYDATREDDRHKCSDVPPSATLVITDDLITIRVSKGTFGLDTMDVVVDGRTVASPNLNKSGLYKVPYSFTKKSTVSATVVDNGYYETRASRSYTPSGDDD